MMELVLKIIGKKDPLDLAEEGGVRCIGFRSGIRGPPHS